MSHTHQSIAELASRARTARQSAEMHLSRIRPAEETLAVVIAKITESEQNHADCIRGTALRCARSQSTDDLLNRLLRELPRQQESPQLRDAATGLAYAVQKLKAELVELQATAKKADEDYRLGSLEYAAQREAAELAVAQASHAK